MISKKKGNLFKKYIYLSMDPSFVVHGFSKDELVRVASKLMGLSKTSGQQMKKSELSKMIHHLWKQKRISKKEIWAAAGRKRGPKTEKKKKEAKKFNQKLRRSFNQSIISEEKKKKQLERKYMKMKEEMKEEEKWYRLQHPKLMYEACVSGDQKQVMAYIEAGEKGWDSGLEGACEGGHHELVDLMLSKGAKYFERGFRGACKGGYPDLAERMYSMIPPERRNRYGSRDIQSDWKKAIEYACEGGHKDMVDYVDSKIKEEGENKYEEGLVPMYAMNGACKGGHLELLKYIMYKYYDKRAIKDGFRIACKGGHRELVDFFKDSGYMPFSDILLPACQGGNRYIVDLVMSKDTNWNNGLRGACMGGHLDIAELMISKGANNWNDGLYEACSEGHIDLAKLMMSKGGVMSSEQFWAALDAASKNGYLDIVMLFISDGNVNILNRILDNVCKMSSSKKVSDGLRYETEHKEEYISMFKLVLEKGATQISETYDNEIFMLVYHLSPNDLSRLVSVPTLPSPFKQAIQKRIVRLREEYSIINAYLDSLLFTSLPKELVGMVTEYTVSKIDPEQKKRNRNE